MFVLASFGPSPYQNQQFVSPFKFSPDFSCLKRRISIQTTFSSSPNPRLHFLQNASTKIIRPSANFHPSIWGDRFITYDPCYITYDACLEHVEMMKEVRRMLVTDASESLKKIRLIDSLQRLGVAYHFEGEIEEVLKQIQDGQDINGIDDNDLYTVALRFRLLRQQGYNVPCDVFNKFKDKDGNFKEDLVNDLAGILCLYEATHLRVHGEDILDEVLEFTTTKLKSILIDLKPPLAPQVKHALRQPLHKGIPRLEARHYISIYQEDETKNEYLLKLAKLDFNLLQSMYQREISQLLGWWKELGLASKLPYARDRLVECYFCAVGVYFEPHYDLARKIFTKFLALSSILDDTYDAYGTLEELQLFTDAIERFDHSAIDGLPEYMKVLYSALLNVCNETKEELKEGGRSYHVKYAKEMIKVLVRAYIIEAKWFNDGYIPTFEEYMQTLLITGGITQLLIFSLVGMEDVMTTEVFDWIMNEPKLLKVSDSMAGSLTIWHPTRDFYYLKFEQERGHVCSSVECYMKQYNVSEEEVQDEFNRRVADAYKEINQACMKPSAVPMPVLLRFVNVSRIVDVTYKQYEDGYTFAYELEEFINSLFIDHIRL